ncbi:MAG TPA: trehalase family glycosidase [Lacipirellulaceae bacterium]|nr:trehalase family glycosidase [Lacipirellulaceae bacterium]
MPAPISMVRSAVFVLLLSLQLKAQGQSIKIVSPSDGVTLDSPLTAKLRWTYPAINPAFHPTAGVRIEISQHEDLSQPIISLDLPENQTSYRLAAAPQTIYYWRITPLETTGPRPNDAIHAKFTTGTPQINTTDDDRIRYKNPRRGAHWTEMRPVEFDQDEPLSPWFDRKAMLDPAMPTYDQLKDRLPVPIFDGHPDAIEAYNYCWRTLLSVWMFAPDAPDHEAVANICGIKAWGVWGSTMVFDTAFINHFARYGNQAYPFVTAFDNCYARQHENGFICRETDKNNREVYSGFPVNPPLFAWAEWESYRITGNKERLNLVFLPIVKQYEWFMTFQRRANGLYWTNGLQEADDSPRNRLMHSAVSATSYQALAALDLAKIARVIGRDDMAAFFESEHKSLGKLVNDHYWDEAHGIYNDLDANDHFITELQPGSFCKHVHMFWPLLAGIAPPDRVERMVKELNNPASFNRRNGVPSLSADSAGYTGGPNGTGQYWCGAVWPSGELMVQESLRATGHEQDWRRLAEKYLNAELEVFNKEHTIKENLSPDTPVGAGMGEFVGWGGIAPVANLIEAVLGLDIDAPANAITWHITHTERHGLKNFQLGDSKVDLTCDKRASATDPCQITINSTGNFTLRLIAGETKEVKITQGEQHITLQADRKNTSP